ncbi:MAG: hypothetical protein OHK0052_13860 [Anaerolineales bacterium]
MLVGAATLWVSIVPFVAMIGWLAVALISIFQMEMSHGTGEPVILLIGMPIFFGLIFCTIALYFPLLIFYIVHLIRNQNGSDTLRIVLGAGLWLLPFVAMPVYFFTYIFPDVPPAWALKTPETFDSVETS